MKYFLKIVAVGLFCLGTTAFGQARILPYGDSVTSSFAPYSSYRYWLWKMLTTQNGFHVDFVGRQWGVGGGSPGNSDFDQHHEGHAGWHADDAAREAGAVASQTQPDIVLLDFGANDIEQGEDNPSTIGELKQVIETFRAANPNIVIVVALPTPIPQHRMKMRGLYGGIRRMARSLRTQASPIYVANLGAGFNLKKHTFDGTHPNDMGELKIARRYARVLKRVLKSRSF